MGLHRQGVFIICVFFAALAVCQGCASHRETSAPTAPAYAPIEGDRTLGNPNAPVVMIQLDSPTCPHCAAVFADSFPHLKADYIDRDKVFYVYRIFPLDKLDAQVQSVALCLPREKYFAFMGAVLRHQAEWDPHLTTKDARTELARLAHEAGLSGEDFDRCFDDPAALDRIDRAGQAAATDFKINGAPSFVINGSVSQGNEGWSALRDRIEAALAKK